MCSLTAAAVLSITAITGRGQKSVGTNAIERQRDSNGTLNDSAQEDNCGVCDDDAANDCTKDCAGTWGGSALADNCGTCDADLTNDCTGDCAGTWGGSALADNCGVCDAEPSNDNETCDDGTDDGGGTPLCGNGVIDAAEDCEECMSCFGNLSRSTNWRVGRFVGSFRLCKDSSL